MIQTMLQIAAAAGTGVLCAAVVRRGAPEFSLVLALAAGGCVLWLAMDGVAMLARAMELLSAMTGLEIWVLEPVFKTVVLSVLTRVTAEVCRCGGESGIAAFVETTGTVLALAVGLPLVQGVLEMIGGMLG